MFPSLPTTVKTWAACYPPKDDFNSLVLEERSLAAQPKPKEVIVRVRAVSLNARDGQIVKDVYPFPMKFASGLVPASDMAGDVVAVGAEVTRFKIGDRCSALFSQSFLSGPYDIRAEDTALGGGIDGVLTEYYTGDESGLVHIPEHLSYVQAACIPCVGVTAYHCLFGNSSTLCTAGETVLVLGTGAVSVFAAQIALAAGARVIATSSSDKKLEKMYKLGVQDGVNYAKHPDWENEVKRITEGRGVDHVIEIGGKATFVHSIRSVRPCGNVAVVGYMSDYSKKKDDGEEILYSNEILVSQALVRGVIVGSRDMHEALHRLLAVSKVVPLVDKVFPFDQAREAFKYQEEGAHFGKVCIEF